MFRLAKRLPAAMGLAVAVSLTAATSARADLEITLQEGSSNPVILTNAVIGQQYTGTVGDYTYSITVQASGPGIGGSNSGGVPLEQINAVITTSSLAANDLVITVTDSDFTNTAPGTSSEYSTTLQTTSLADGSSVSAFGFVNSTSNATPTVSSSGLSSTSAADLYVGTGSTLTLGNQVTVTGLNGTDTITVTTVDPVPEPASMMAAFTAVPFLGLGAWLRRRNQAALATAQGA
jgi:hypothetical protein